MRYYEIKITGKGIPPVIFSSFAKDVYDPCALDIELDIVVATFATAAGRVPSYITIWGISQQTLAQVPDFNGRNIEIQVGMSKGLPLVNASQRGLVISGTILQAFGNWLGVDQTLSFYLGPRTGSNSDPLNLVLDWRAGMPLGLAVANCLKIAYPALRVINNIKTNLVQPHDEKSFHYSIGELAIAVKQLSLALVGGSYAGVEMVISNTDVVIFDGSTKENPAKIEFKDLVGQPTWLEPGRIQVTTVMRADVFPDTVIKLPPTPITQSAQNLSRFDDKSAFQGIFNVGSVRHVGRFRQPDAAAWVTVIDCYGNGSGA